MCIGIDPLRWVWNDRLESRPHSQIEFFNRLIIAHFLHFRPSIIVTQPRIIEQIELSNRHDALCAVDFGRTPTRHAPGVCSLRYGEPKETDPCGLQSASI